MSIAMSLADSEELTCTRCGAPLDWDGVTTKVTCRYCQSVLPMRAKVAAPAPAPPPVPAPTVTRREDSGSTAKGIAVVLGLLLLVAGAVVAVAVSRGDVAFTPGKGEPKPAGVSAAEIAQVDLATTPERLARRFGGKVVEDGVTLPLRDAGFTSIGFFWDEAHLDHVRMVVLNPPSSGIPASVLPRAHAQLGQELRPSSTRGHAFNGPGVSLSLASGFVINAVDLEDPRWKQRIAALFTVLRGAGLSTSDVLDERTKSDVLNLGYPLARLTELDFGVPVEIAEREVRRVVPGAVSAGDHHDIGLRHAWFQRARLVWTNAPSGKLKRVELSAAPNFAFDFQREDVARCVHPLLGKPRVTIQNHLANEHTYEYEANPKRSPQLRARAGDFTILPPTGAKDAAEGVKRLLAVLASCG